MPIGDRIRRRHHRDRRIVRSGETFTSEELDAGEVELELPRPSREPPPDQQAEPWGTARGDDRFAGRDRAYRAFLESWARDHPDEDPGGER
jgi:hypothetical protein